MKIYKIASSESQDEFFKKRMKGAKKMAKMAKEKSGPSILTYWHFAAKEEPYEMVLKAIKNGESMDYYKEKCSKLLRKLDVENMSQKEFQTVMGELEVWGEALCQLGNGE